MTAQLASAHKHRLVASADPHASFFDHQPFLCLVLV
jgi:hypothetical protein